ncbi:Transcription factor atf21 [Fusarium agapanthi]|uniref:Transcription factor atf21 n=1 Tax=Fusarium agapanthi TaxID=1803897 RepID=A0A9P5AW72_9HYPO|nr:Transcription factor atf21 [Fusarium agapanthi]
MGTVYAPFQQQLHPSRDGSQPCYRNMQPMAQDPSGMYLYGTLPQSPREQWWSPNNAAFTELSNTAAPSIYAQQQHPQYAYDQDASTQWTSPSTSTQSYPVPSPSTESTSIENATGDSENRRGSSATQPDKRKRNATRSTTSKAPRRAPTRKTIISETAAEKPKGRGKGKGKQTAKVQSTKMRSPCPESEELDEHSKKVQERNRIASNKFRVKKREDTKKLRADEEDMERANRDLSSCVSELTMQVYELKMKLLQHTDCKCHLIQDYIANEAHRYIQDLSEGKQNHATPPLCPYNQHN